MAKEKEKGAGKNIRISDEAFEILKDYCEKNGLKIGVFVSKLIIEKTKHAK